MLPGTALHLSVYHHSDSFLISFNIFSSSKVRIVIMLSAHIPGNLTQALHHILYQQNHGIVQGYITIVLYGEGADQSNILHVY